MMDGAILAPVCPTGPVTIERVYDADRMNSFVNHPSVFSIVKGLATKHFDLSAVAANRDHVFLVGEHGGSFFIRHQPGIYEVHTAVLPSGRGRWTVRFGRAAAHYMFTATDAVEVLTKVPEGNVPAFIGAKAIGMRLDFETRPIWPTDDGMVPVRVFSQTIQDWVKHAPRLVDRGQWFHRHLEEQFAVLGRDHLAHADDIEHDRYVGAAVEMMAAGQIFKSVGFYNRWAVMAGYQPVRIAEMSPAYVVDIIDAKIRVRPPHGFEVI